MCPCKHRHSNTHAQPQGQTHTHKHMHTHTKTSVCGFPLWASNHTLSSFCRGFSFLLSRFFEYCQGPCSKPHVLMFLQDLDTHTHTHTHTHTYTHSTLHVERPSPGWPTCWPRQAARVELMVNLGQGRMILTAAFTGHLLMETPT